MFDEAAGRQARLANWDYDPVRPRSMTSFNVPLFGWNIVDDDEVGTRPVLDLDEASTTQFDHEEESVIKYQDVHMTYQPFWHRALSVACSVVLLHHVKNGARADGHIDMTLAGTTITCARHDADPVTPLMTFHAQGALPQVTEGMTLITVDAPAGPPGSDSSNSLQVVAVIGDNDHVDDIFHSRSSLRTLAQTLLRCIDDDASTSVVVECNVPDNLLASFLAHFFTAPSALPVDDWARRALCTLHGSCFTYRRQIDQQPFPASCLMHIFDVFTSDRRTSLAPTLRLAVPPVRDVAAVSAAGHKHLRQLARDLAAYVEPSERPVPNVLEPSRFKQVPMLNGDLEDDVLFVPAEDDAEPIPRHKLPLGESVVSLHMCRTGAVRGKFPSQFVARIGAGDRQAYAFALLSTTFDKAELFATTTTVTNFRYEPGDGTLRLMFNLQGREASISVYDRDILLANTTVPVVAARPTVVVPSHMVDDRERKTGNAWVYRHETYFKTTDGNVARLERRRASAWKRATPAYGLHWRAVGDEDARRGFPFVWELQYQDTDAAHALGEEHVWMRDLRTLWRGLRTARLRVRPRDIPTWHPGMHIRSVDVSQFLWRLEGDPDDVTGQENTAGLSMTPIRASDDALLFIGSVPGNARPPTDDVVHVDGQRYARVRAVLADVSDRVRAPLRDLMATSDAFVRPHGGARAVLAIAESERNVGIVTRLAVESYVPDLVVDYGRRFFEPVHAPEPRARRGRRVSPESQRTIERVLRDAVRRVGRDNVMERIELTDAEYDRLRSGSAADGEPIEIPDDLVVQVDGLRLSPVYAPVRSLIPIRACPPLQTGMLFPRGREYYTTNDATRFNMATLLPGTVWFLELDTNMCVCVRAQDNPVLEDSMYHVDGSLVDLTPFLLLPPAPPHRPARLTLRPAGMSLLHDGKGWLVRRMWLVVQGASRYLTRAKPYLHAGQRTGRDAGVPHVRCVADEPLADVVRRSPDLQAVMAFYGTPVQGVQRVA